MSTELAAAQTAPDATNVATARDITGTATMVNDELVLRVRSATAPMRTTPVCACGDPCCLPDTRRIIAMVERAPIRAFLFYGWRRG